MSCASSLSPISPHQSFEKNAQKFGLRCTVELVLVYAEERSGVPPSSNRANHSEYNLFLSYKQRTVFAWIRTQASRVHQWPGFSLPPLIRCQSAITRGAQPAAFVNRKWSKCGVGVAAPHFLNNFSSDPAVRLAPGPGFDCRPSPGPSAATEEEGPPRPGDPNHTQRVPLCSIAHCFLRLFFHPHPHRVFQDLFFFVLHERLPMIKFFLR